MCLQYKSFENTVEKGEIAHDSVFTLLENSPFSSKSLKFTVWDRVNPLPDMKF